MQPLKTIDIIKTIFDAQRKCRCYQEHHIILKEILSLWWKSEYDKGHLVIMQEVLTLWRTSLWVTRRTSLVWVETFLRRTGNAGATSRCCACWPPNSISAANSHAETSRATVTSHESKAQHLWAQHLLISHSYLGKGRRPPRELAKMIVDAYFKVGMDDREHLFNIETEDDNNNSNK